MGGRRRRQSRDRGACGSALGFRFSERKPLAALKRREWDALCDGCGKCCLAKLEDEDSGEINYTNVACKLLDLQSCRCRDYAHRSARVPDCIELTPQDSAVFAWLPNTCAYRLVAAGLELPWWHPLVSGDRDSVHRAGTSVRGRAIPESEAGALEHHLVHWPL